MFQFIYFVDLYVIINICLESLYQPDHSPAPRRRARRMCNSMGIRPRSNQKPGAHLEFGDPQLEHLRAWVKTKTFERHCHPRLVANFDQVWTTLYKPNKKPLQKTDGKSAMLTTDPLAANAYLRRIRHNVERMLDCDFTENDPATERKLEPDPPVLTGSKASTGTVDQWRVARTLTTLSWIDGFLGKGFVTYKKGTLSEQTREWAEKNLGQWLVLGPPQLRSHVWNEATYVSYLRFLSHEVRARRVALNLDGTHRAMIILDQAGAHMSKTFAALQKKWCTENNCASRLHYSAIYCQEIIQVYSYTGRYMLIYLILCVGLQASPSTRLHVGSLGVLSVVPTMVLDEGNMFRTKCFW